ncbi:unnamed protein product [Moneuplotes crassus]|uniref:Uncharacterized protein n=1 Tax=Euplotes crassus TaxID=5936 RepID=A0AAD1X920_EUPCR|nr:unnamed protein product [Moneuplotes crassus]
MSEKKIVKINEVDPLLKLTEKQVEEQLGKCEIGSSATSLRVTKDKIQVMEESVEADLSDSDTEPEDYIFQMKRQNAGMLNKMSPEDQALNKLSSMQNIVNRRKIQRFKKENDDLKRHLERLRMAHRQNTKNLQSLSQAEAYQKVQEKLEESTEVFNKEISFLQTQFNKIRYEIIKKEHTLAKFLQIAYDQEMYFNELKRIVQRKQFSKAEEICRMASPISVGSLMNFETVGEFNLQNKLIRAQYDLLGTQNISVMHDNTKNKKRILHQMSKSPMVNLGDDLDSQYMSKQIKSLRKGKKGLMEEIDKVDQLKKELSYSRMEYDTLRSMYMETLQKLDHKEEEVDKMKSDIELYKKNQNLEYIRMKKRQEHAQEQATKKVEDVKNKYKGYVENLRKELKLSNKLNTRLNEYIDKLKKELVFAKIIMKDPKMSIKANNIMNYSLYKVDTSASTSRSIRSTKRPSLKSSSSRRLTSHTPNGSFSFCPSKNVESYMKSMGTSSPPISSNGKLNIHNFLKLNSPER